ncbi:MAG: glycosyltransferase family 2 protein [Candidatus Omnitrophota bacterium]|jgi:glycosyltransferase involved in cell wall biosynthesis
MSKNRAVAEWLKVAEMLLILYGLTTGFYYYLAEHNENILKVSYYIIITLFVYQSVFIFLQVVVAMLCGRTKKFADHRPVQAPRTTFVICAYLPNEIQFVNTTILHILEDVRRPTGGIEVILAYNTPFMEDLELSLKQLAYKWPELILANAYGSRSKSENLNYAINMASGEMLVLLDADHLIAPDCLDRAWGWIAKGYDIIQGHCTIRNDRASIVSAMVSVEFEAIYGVSHFARGLVFDAALFGGSNGFWKTSVAKDVGFRTDMLTEDIDATLRASLKGYKIVHDKDIISTEIAPETIGALWFQRKRWAQGWLQCALKYQIPVLTSKFLKLRQRFCWTMLLIWRVSYDVFSHMLFPIVIAYWLYRGRVEFPMTPYIWFALIFTMMTGPLETVAAYMNQTEPKKPKIWFLLYATTAFWYTMFKNFIQVVAIRDEISGERSWIVSKR